MSKITIITHKVIGSHSDKTEEAALIIKRTFSHLAIIEKFSVGEYVIDLYMPKYKIAIQFVDYEAQAVHFLSDILECKFFYCKPESDGFNIGFVLNEIIKAIYEDDDGFTQEDYKD